MKTLFFACVSLALACGAAEVDFRKPGIVPEPKEMTYRANVPVRIVNETVFAVTAPDEAAAKWVADKAKLWFGVTPKVSFAEGPAAADPKALDPFNEEYELVAEPGRISLKAKTLKGVKYAMHTLRQVAERESVGVKLRNYWLPALKVKDRPDLGFRGVHFCFMPEMTPTLVEHQIRAAAYLKFNFAVIENWGVFKGERNPDFCVPNAPLTVAEAKRLTAIADDLGLTLIPQINIFGHASLERGCAAKHATIDYRPEYQPLFEPCGGWNWCLSNPDARAKLRDFVAELHEAFGNPPFFHIGCDEAAPPSCPTCRAVKPYAKLVERHITEVAAMLRARGARAMMWHDMLLEKGERWKPFYANGDKDEAKMVDTLPKDIVICDWYYAKARADGDYPTLRMFKSLGFTVLTCPWYTLDGTAAQCRFAHANGIDGVMSTTWGDGTGKERGRYVANAFAGTACQAWSLDYPPSDRWKWNYDLDFIKSLREVEWDMGLEDVADTGTYGE